MQNYKLIPYPRKITERAGCFCAEIGNVFEVFLGGESEHISFVTDENLSREEYKLEIAESGITIASSGEKGRINGVSTLAQIVKQFGGKLPCVIIRDKPRLPIRMVQVCIGQVNAELRRDWIVRFVRKMAELKITHIGLYFEWNFRFPSVPQLSSAHYPDKSDMEFTQREAEKYGIEIVPEFALMGHSKDLLELEAFAELRECAEDVCEAKASYDSLCFTSPEVRMFIKNVVNDICDIFHGELIHIGGDEVGHIGECPTCKKRGKEVGKMGLYLDYLEFVSELLEKRGKKMGVWADMLLMLTDDSPFWEGKDLELSFRAAAIERLKKLKDRIVIFDWWYVGVNKASVDFFLSLGLKVVACTSSNGCYASAVNFNQFYNSKILCDYAAERNCDGVMMCDWINYLGDHAEQQYPFYALLARLGWSGPTAAVDDGFFDAVSLQLYGIKDKKLEGFWRFCGKFESPLLSFFPDSERGLALRKYVFHTDNPLAFYLCSRHYLGSNAENYAKAVKECKKKADELRKEFGDDPYAEFALLPCLIHETLYDSFSVIDAAQTEYARAAQMQYRDEKSFAESLNKCADKLKELDGVYENTVKYAEAEYKLLGNDGPACVRLAALGKNLGKLVRFIRGLQDGHRPLPSFKNISDNLFSMPQCSEWNIRELDWAAEKAEFRAYSVDNGKSWFCRPFDCNENH